MAAAGRLAAKDPLHLMSELLSLCMVFFLYFLPLTIGHVFFLKEAAGLQEHRSAVF